MKSSSFIRISSPSRVMPGVADQHLDRALVLLDLGEGAVDGLGVGDVALDAEEAVGGAAAAVGHGDRVTRLGEGAGDGQPDPRLPPVTSTDLPTCHSPAPTAVPYAEPSGSPEVTPGVPCNPDGRGQGVATCRLLPA